MIVRALVPPLTIVAVVVVVSAPTAVFHARARFVTFTEPSPVAVSYPVPVIHAGVVVLLGLTRTPFVAEVVLLQLSVPPEHGTESLPFVTSRKAQELGGGDAGLVNKLELQLVNVSPLAMV